MEYDPALYQRDRGELDWDQRSIGTTNILAGDGSSIGPSKSIFYAGRASPAPSYGRGSPAPSVYDRYMSKGPTHVPNSSSEIELSGINTNTDQLPLLASQQGYPDAVPPRPVSRSNQYYQQSPLGGAPAPGSMQQGQYPPVPTMYGEAPLRQPYRQPSNLSQNSQQAPIIVILLRIAGNRLVIRLSKGRIWRGEGRIGNRDGLCRALLYSPPLGFCISFAVASFRDGLP